MTPDQARDIIHDALHQVAPDIDANAIKAGTELRDRAELDSLDFLNFVEILSDRSGVRIDEDDYPNLATLDGCVAFLTARTGS